MDHAAWLQQMRREKDEFFKRSPHSPFEPGEWRPLEYYEPDAAYRVQASWSPIADGKHLRFPTSTGEEREYVEAGKLSFRVGGKDVTLVAYASATHVDSLFVPFRDKTSGDETYGAGRYLDIPYPDAPTVTLDLNLAYNPYCAYSEAYSCPLPPRDNWLDVPIRAGEKNFR